MDESLCTSQSGQTRSYLDICGCLVNIFCIALVESGAKIRYQCREGTPWREVLILCVCVCVFVCVGAGCCFY